MEDVLRRAWRLFFFSLFSITQRGAGSTCRLQRCARTFSMDREQFRAAAHAAVDESTSLCTSLVYY